MTVLDRIDDARIPELVGLYRSTWWAADRDVDATRALVANSDLVVALVDGPTDRLVAFARVLTDFTVFAMIFDVIVTPELRGTGLGRDVIDALLARSELHDVASIELVCQPDLVGFHEQFGFSTDVGASRLMRRTADPRLRGDG